MISVGLYYDVVPGREKEFEEAFNAVKGMLEGFRGFVFAALYRRVDKPNSYLIYSEWESLEAFKAFTASKAFREITSNYKGMFERRPYNRVYQPLNVQAERSDSPA